MYVPRLPKAQKQRSTPATIKNKANGAHDTLLDLESYLTKRDFIGAVTLLRLNDQSSMPSVKFAASKGASPRNDNDIGSSVLSAKLMTMWWLAYCHFQSGDYQTALEFFDLLLENPSTRNDSKQEINRTIDESSINAWRLSRACCLYYLQHFEDAEREALLTPRQSLCNRLLYLIAHQRTHGEKVLLDRYKNLSSSSIADQLALAFTSVLQRNFQEAIEIYKRIVLQNRDQVVALHVYLSMCYFRMDYYDVALELLAVYLEGHADSFVATNLKACNQFRLYSGVEAKQVLDKFIESNPAHPCSLESHQPVDFMGISAVCTHNRKIFEASSGVSLSNRALSTLSPLIDCIPEAKMNLVIMHLHCHEYREAFEVIGDLEPTNPTEHIIKAIVHAMISNQTVSKEHSFLAEKHFHAVGVLPSECDTIPGRQAMASYYLLRKEYTDAIVYLQSISTYLASSDAFNWNYGIALGITGNFKEAQEVLMRVQSENLRKDLVYCTWLARVYIENRTHAAQAWELYLQMENTADAFKLLKQIADDYYRTQQYYFAVKAFDVLERLDPDPEYWEAKRGACMGYFQQVAIGAIPLLTNQCDEMIKLILQSKNVEASSIGMRLKRWVHSWTK